MANGGGKIWGPVSRTDVKTVLQSSENRLTYLCRLDSINPMSKNKPINYNKIGHLTDYERRGMQSDIDAGYYYGVKLVGSGWNDFAKIHETKDTTLFTAKGLEWGYPSRLGDFQGYDHNAVPDIGISPLATSVITGTKLVVTLNVAPNGTGIPYSEVLEATHATSGNVDSYLMAIVTREGTSGGGLTRLSGSPVNLTTTSTTNYEVQLNQAVGSYIVSVLLYAPQHSQELAQLPAVGEWRDLGNQAVWNNDPIVLPNGYWHSLSIIPNNLPYVSVISVTTNSTYIRMGYTFSASATSYTLYISGYIGKSYVSKTIPVREIIQWNWSDLGMVVDRSISINLDMQVEIDGVMGARKNFTATVPIPTSGYEVYPSN